MSHFSLKAVLPNDDETESYFPAATKIPSFFTFNLSVDVHVRP